MDTCPKCHRKLLSHASKRCNWCGTWIDDEDYKKSSERARQEYFKHEEESAKLSVDRMRAIDTHDSVLGREFNPLTKSPVFSNQPPRPERPSRKQPEPKTWPETPLPQQPDIPAPQADIPAPAAANKHQLKELKAWYASRDGKNKRNPR